MGKFNSINLKLLNCFCLIVSMGVGLRETSGAPAPSIARIWNEEILAAIRIDRPNPPVHARNLFHLDTAMYDAWAIYDTVAVGYIHHERATANDIDGARREAISYAAYQILKHRYAASVAASTSLAAFDARMESLGYDNSIVTTVGDSPAARGNRIAADIIAWGLKDGSNEQGGYDDLTYVNAQPAMPVMSTPFGAPRPMGGIPLGSDPNRWQPLLFYGFAGGQNGTAAPSTQKYVGVTWRNAVPFSIHHGLSIDPGPPSRMNSNTESAYRAGAVEVLRASSELGSDEIADMSPGVVGNNPIGADSGHGHPLNPATGQPYPPNTVRLGDYSRVMSEFWADGPSSETPPGHWHVLANQVADHPLTVKKINGQGSVVSDLEWDVKTYFALGAAVHDAACVAWSVKRQYEGARPITMIRWMASLGQSSDPDLPSYNAHGLPLVPGVIQLSDSGVINVFSWPGQPDFQQAFVSPVRWMPGTDWVPYQRVNFVTPAFPGYISGHSTFSSAAAVVLEKITGNRFFPGGIGKVVAEQNAYLRFEVGPNLHTEIQWATYQDAADLAGRSRRWGGIHVPEDDFKGRIAGAQVGQSAWALAQSYFSGTVLTQNLTDPTGSPAATIQIASRPDGREIKVPETVRGLPYTFQTSNDLINWISLPAEPGSEAGLKITDSDSGPTRFFRVLTAAP